MTASRTGRVGRIVHLGWPSRPSASAPGPTAGQPAARPVQRAGSARRDQHGLGELDRRPAHLDVRELDPHDLTRLERCFDGRPEPRLFAGLEPDPVAHVPRDEALEAGVVGCLDGRRVHA